MLRVKQKKDAHVFLPFISVMQFDPRLSFQICAWFQIFPPRSTPFCSESQGLPSYAMIKSDNMRIPIENDSPYCLRFVQSRQVVPAHLPFFTGKKKNQSAASGGLIFIITSLTFSPAKFSLQPPSLTAGGQSDHRTF